MSLSKPKNLEEALIYHLRDGEQKATALAAILQTTGKTKQGVYAALRKLKAEEIVVIYKGRVALNTAWLREVRALVDHMQDAYEGETRTFDFLSLGDRESALYSFSNIIHLDAFWGHVQNTLVSATPKNEPIYAYNPHYWFYIARKKTEQKLLEDLVGQKRQFLMTVAGDTALDKAIRSEFANDYVQYAFKKLYDRPEYYITAIGDYLIEVFLDKQLARSIEKVYSAHRRISPETVKAFEILLQTRSRHKIKISRNQRKADAMRQKLGKNFYVKKFI